MRLGRYYLKELSAPNGYLLDETEHKFSIDYVDEHTPVIQIDLGEIIDLEPTGKITVVKTNTNQDTVQGAKFVVIAKEDIVNKAGTVTYFHAGDEVGSIDTSTNSSGTLENLHLGKYYVQEVFAPTGYLLNENKYEVELTYANQTTSVVLGDATIVDKEPTGVIDVSKVDVLTGNGVRPDGQYHHGDATFAGAVYTLYAGENITNYAKTVTYYRPNDAIATFTFDAKGFPSITILNNADGVNLSIDGSKLKGVPMGQYYLRETTSPTGYTPDTTTYNFRVDYIDQLTEEIQVQQTVTEQVQRAKFEIIKVSTDTNTTAPTVDKAKFTAILEKYVKYYGSFDEAYKHIEEFAEDEWCTFEIGLNGHGVSDFLAYGDYVVSETHVPENDINQVEDFTVTIDKDSDGVIKEVVENDSPFTSYIKMVKKDKKTGKTVTFSNATFELYRYDKATKEWNLVQCKVGSNYYREWSTDENGICETQVKLSAGTYRLVETKIPDGFNQLDDNLIFYVNTTNPSLEYDLNEDAWITVEVENEQPTGKIVLNKSIAIREGVDKSFVDGHNFGGIQFRLKANKDIIDWADGSIIYKEGQIIGTYNLDADGNLEIAGLPMGSYNLEEISTKDGLVLDSTIHNIIFEQKDTKTKEYVQNLDISNDTTLVQISKSDITGENEVVGAKLQVIDENGNIVDEWISKDKPHTIEGLLVGHEYTLHEEVVADGYVKASDIKFTVENTANPQKVTMIDEQVKVSKTNIEGQLLIGAKLQVIDKQGNVIDAWVTDGKIHNVKNLIEGETYIIQEIEVPDGYVKMADEEFTVPTDKRNLDIELIDKIVIVKKTDFATGEELEGAQLVVTDKDGNVVDEWISGKEVHIVEGLVEGETYTLTEKTCPDGYEQAESIEFTVTSDKETQVIEMKDKAISTNEELTENKVTPGKILNVQTGNEINDMIWLILIGISVFVLIVCLLYLKRKNKK